MNELHRISREMKTVLARMHAADDLASESWRQLRTRHGWALVATAVGTGALAVWWRWRQQHNAPIGGHGDDLESAGGPGDEPMPPAPPAWRSLALALLPVLLPRIAMRLVPLPWRPWVSHPLLHRLLRSLLNKGMPGKKHR